MGTGHRANLVLVREGQYELFYSHWAAISLPHDLFWGPEHAIAFTEAQRAVDGWLDDVWAEGGSVIDADRRTLRLFGGQQLRGDVPLRRLYLALLAVVWRGWDVGWAYDGICDLAAHVGLPREAVLDLDISLPDSALQPPDEEDEVPLVGSVQQVDGSLRLYPIYDGVGSALMKGPGLVEALGLLPWQERLSLARQTSDFPVGGFHLDLRTNDLRYWTAMDDAGGSEQIAARWPGWTTTWLHERYEDQLSRCDGRLVFPERMPEALLAVLGPDLLDPPWGSTSIEVLIGLVGSPQRWDRALANHEIAFGADPLRVPLETRAMSLLRAGSRIGLIAPGAWGQEANPPAVPDATGPVRPPVKEPRWWQRWWRPGG